MGVVETGAAIGAIVDAANDDGDGIADGAIKGALVGIGLKIVAPIVVVGALGFAAYRGISKLRSSRSAPQPA